MPSVPLCILSAFASLAERLLGERERLSHEANQCVVEVVVTRDREAADCLPANLNTALLVVAPWKVSPSLWSRVITSRRFIFIARASGYAFAVPLESVRQGERGGLRCCQDPRTSQ